MDIDSMLAYLREIYGEWKSVAVITSIIEYIKREVIGEDPPGTTETVSARSADRILALTHAVLRSHSISRGAPDVAAFELAIKRAEDRGESIRRPPHIMDWSTSSLRDYRPTAEERGGMISFKAAAKELGIDTDVDGWFASYVMQRVQRVARENGRDRLPGDKRRWL